MKSWPVCLVLLLAYPSPAAHAAEGFDSCTGVVDTLPFAITEAGTWCLQHDLHQDTTVFAALSISQNNVVLDCNDFELRGPGTADTNGYGVWANLHSNVTVRNCTIRGFGMGIAITGDNATIEHSHLDGNRERGIYLSGNGNVVRGNLVTRSGGGSTGTRWAFGISVFGDTDVIDNTVNGVAATPGSNERAFGIFVNENGAEPNAIVVTGNRVRGVVADGTGSAWGIGSYGTGPRVYRGNVLFGPVAGAGFECNGPGPLVVTGNIVVAAATALQGCSDDGGNTFRN